MTAGDGGEVGDGAPKLQCWICLAEDEPEDLIQPCGCRGSIGYVHEECILSFLTFFLHILNFKIIYIQIIPNPPNFVCGNFAQ